MSDERTFIDGMMDDHVYRIGDDIKDAGERLMYLDGCSADDMRWAIRETISDIRKALDKLKEQEAKVVNWIQAKGRSDHEEEFSDEMINEAGELAGLTQDVEKSLIDATSVECMDDMLANLDDAKHALESLKIELHAAHARAKKFIQEKGRANRAHQ